MKRMLKDRGRKFWVAERGLIPPRPPHEDPRYYAVIVHLDSQLGQSLMKLRSSGNNHLPCPTLVLCDIGSKWSYSRAVPRIRPLKLREMKGLNIGRPSLPNHSRQIEKVTLQSEKKQPTQVSKQGGANKHIQFTFEYQRLVKRTNTTTACATRADCQIVQLFKAV